MLLPQRKMPPHPSLKSGTRGSYPDEKWSAFQCPIISYLPVRVKATVVSL
ncbi:hypothetical protein E2C01_074286 [Portunus trituberculatus]|uniref:Uncharacterized protein n=1 Tax=Portunus trituberculatus TaxID=210409 RepID=A0A5B7I7N2_PORTR|nr:hypothetical protein [Portunus trituberculatus]